MKFVPQLPAGATPLDPNEMNGLIPQFISTQGQLNSLEQENILAGKNWALKTKKDILQESFVRELHKKMYGNVWNWAGKYRTGQKSIGIEPSQISSQVYILMKDIQVWIEENTYDWIEILTRFHYRLVFIHPFPNGNGRYARLHTELVAKKFDQEIPTWGANKFNGKINRESEIRTQYIEALKTADSKNLKPLRLFIYS